MNTPILTSSAADDAIRRAYQATRESMYDAAHEDEPNANEVSSATMDDRIRAAARRAVQSRPGPLHKNWFTRHRLPLSAAAVVMLSSSLMMVAVNERAELLPETKIASVASSASSTNDALTPPSKPMGVALEPKISKSTQDKLTAEATGDTAKFKREEKGRARIADESSNPSGIERLRGQLTPPVMSPASPSATPPVPIEKVQPPPAIRSGTPPTFVPPPEVALQTPPTQAKPTTRVTNEAKQDKAPQAVTSAPTPAPSANLISAPPPAAPASPAPTPAPVTAPSPITTPLAESAPKLAAPAATMAKDTTERRTVGARGMASEIGTNAPQRGLSDSESDNALKKSDSGSTSRVADKVIARNDGPPVQSFISQLTTLKRAGKDAEFRRELTRFRKLYPNELLPKELTEFESELANARAKAVPSTPPVLQSVLPPPAPQNEPNKPEENSAPNPPPVETPPK
jgi:hypothetical protein